MNTSFHSVKQAYLDFTNSVCSWVRLGHVRKTHNLMQICQDDVGFGGVFDGKDGNEWPQKSAEEVLS